MFQNGWYYPWLVARWRCLSCRLFACKNITMWRFAGNGKFSIYLLLLIIRAPLLYCSTSSGAKLGIHLATHMSLMGHSLYEVWYTSVISCSCSELQKSINLIFRNSHRGLCGIGNNLGLLSSNCWNRVTMMLEIRQTLSYVWQLREAFGARHLKQKRSSFEYMLWKYTFICCFITVTFSM